MFLHNRLNGLLMTAAMALALGACTEADIDSPGEIGQIDDGGDDGGNNGGNGGNGGGLNGECPDGVTEVAQIDNNTTCELSGVIAEDLELNNDVLYVLNGDVEVGNDVGSDGSNADGAPAVLTIQPGTTIVGAEEGDSLVINRGSQIVASGTSDAPIVFTALADFQGTVSEGDRGLWGGIVIAGQAPINACEGTGGAADCEAQVEGSTVFYGGNSPTDNSGALEYVQVKYAGFEVFTNNELNGITFAGVGSGTEVNHIQVHNNLDDGVEFFGGTVNVSHLVLTGIGDDSIDWDAGWQGNIQFAVVEQSDDDGDRMIEADNNSDDQTATPISNPNLSNFTFVGSSAENAGNAILLRVGTNGTLVNGVVTGSAECLDIDDQATFDQSPTFNSVLLDCATNFVSDDEPAADVEAVFNAGSNNVSDEANSLNARFFPGPVEQAVTAFDATTLNDFFVEADYIGAFSPDETESSNWAAGWTYGLFDEPECPEGTTENGTLNDMNRCVLSGTISEDMHLVRGNIYELSGAVDVGVDTGSDGENADGVPTVLTIDAGVTLFGAADDDHLVINRGSQIVANGTRNSPITFTALKDVEGSASAGERGLWGGIVINGRAPINNCESGTGGDADCEAQVEGASAFYGGNDPEDDSGSLRYVRVKYAGFEVFTGNELNGITFAGVGSGTEVNHIQVHNNFDDGVEFFGGTVNVSHLVLTGIGDDSIDWDAGWQGNMQYVIVVQADDTGDRMIEADNNSDAQTATPTSNPNLSNFTFVGSENAGTAILLRVGTNGTLVNGVVTGSAECLDLDDNATFDQSPTFNSVMLDCATTFVADDEPASDVEAVFNAGSNNETEEANTLEATFVNGPTESDIEPFDPTGLSDFFESVDYIGAVRDADDDWWQAWTCGLESGSDC